MDRVRRKNFRRCARPGPAFLIRSSGPSAARQECPDRQRRTGGNAKGHP